MVSLYQLKPRFQAWLRPAVGCLPGLGITANMVTVAALLLSVGLGALLLLVGGTHRELFLLLPVWMFGRMALNAVDGMLAREFGQQSTLGAYLNELSDVVADAALALPFVAIGPFDWPSVAAVVFLAAVSELAGALGPMVGSPRRYDGPMGKSDRALVFGALGLWVGLTPALPDWAFWLMPAVAGAVALNIVNRVRGGVAASRAGTLRE